MNFKMKIRISQDINPSYSLWIRTDGMNDDELVQKGRDMGIDILVDLA